MDCYEYDHNGILILSEVGLRNELYHIITSILILLGPSTPFGLDWSQTNQTKSDFTQNLRTIN